MWNPLCTGIILLGQHPVLTIGQSSVSFTKISSVNNKAIGWNIERVVFVSSFAVRMPGILLPNEFFIRDEDHNDQDGDVYIYSGYQIDVTDAIIDCLVMNIDSRYLCTPDCKGLCPTCGTNLNFETCSCADDSIDPRWEKLKALMDDNTH